jgi:hypothetical protein
MWASRLRVCHVILVCLGGVASVARAQLDIVDTEPGQFIDISLTGQRIVLGDDEELENFPVPFGNTVLPGGTVVVANNGGLAFGTIFDPNLDPINQPIANNAAFGGSQSLVAYWDDIGNHIGDIFFEDLGDRYIFQWHRKPLSGVPTTTVTFQVQVFANVLAAPIYAQFIYTDIEGEGAEGGVSATIGYQNGPAPFNDVEWSFNTQFAVSDGTVLSLVPEPATVLLLAAGGLLLTRRRRESGLWCGRPAGRP